MLVERQPLGLFVEVIEAFVEPVREAGVDACHRRAPLVAEGGPARPGTAAAGLVRDTQRRTLIESAAEQRRLAESRMADNDDPLRIELLHGFEIIDDAREAPRPGG